MVVIFTVSQSPLTPGTRSKPRELGKLLPDSGPQFPHLYLEGIGLV